MRRKYISHLIINRKASFLLITLRILQLCLLTSYGQARSSKKTSFAKIGLTPNGYFPLMYQPLFHFDKMSFFIIGICLIKYFTWIRDWIFSLQNIVTLTGPPGNIIVYRFYN